MRKRLPCVLDIPLDLSDELRWAGKTLLRAQTGDEI